MHLGGGGGRLPWSVSLGLRAAILAIVPCLWLDLALLAIASLPSPPACSVAVVAVRVIGRDFAGIIVGRAVLLVGAESLASTLQSTCCES